MDSSVFFVILCVVLLAFCFFFSVFVFCFLVLHYVFCFLLYTILSLLLSVFWLLPIFCLLFWVFIFPVSRVHVKSSMIRRILQILHFMIDQISHYVAYPYIEPFRMLSGNRIPNLLDLLFVWPDSDRTGQMRKASSACSCLSWERGGERDALPYLVPSGSRNLRNGRKWWY